MAIATSDRLALLYFHLRLPSQPSHHETNLSSFRLFLNNELINE
jgi:hypothetical protein